MKLDKTPWTYGMQRLDLFGMVLVWFFTIKMHFTFLNIEGGRGTNVYHRGTGLFPYKPYFEEDFASRNKGLLWQLKSQLESRRPILPKHNH